MTTLVLPLLLLAGQNVIEFNGRRIVVDAPAPAATTQATQPAAKPRPKAPRLSRDQKAELRVLRKRYALHVKRLKANAKKDRKGSTDRGAVFQKQTDKLGTPITNRRSLQERNRAKRRASAFLWRKVKEWSGVGQPAEGFRAIAGRQYQFWCPGFSVELYRVNADGRPDQRVSRPMGGELRPGRYRIVTHRPDEQIYLVVLQARKVP